MTTESVSNTVARMSKKKQWAIVGGAIAILVLLSLVSFFASTPRPTTNEIDDYLLYVAEQHMKAVTIMGTLAELATDPRPYSMTWRYETTECLEQLKQVRTELTVTLPPGSLSDKDPETADAIYEAALDCQHHLIRAGYLLLDYGHAKDRQDVMALTYLAEFHDELDTARDYSSLLQLLLMLAKSP